MDHCDRWYGAQCGSNELGLPTTSAEQLCGEAVSRGLHSQQDFLGPPELQAEKHTKSDVNGETYKPLWRQCTLDVVLLFTCSTFKSRLNVFQVSK